MQLPDPLSEADLQRLANNPEAITALGVEFQLALANYAGTPSTILEVLAGSSDAGVSQAARLHVSLAGEMTEGWLEALDAELRAAELGQNDRLAVELLKFAPVPDCFLSEWVPAECLIEALGNPYLPVRYRLKFLERVAQEGTLELRLQVAQWPETPAVVLSQLAGDLELPVRLAVKSNPNCPPALMELVEGQHAVAADRNADAEELAMLGESRWAWVRLAVAQNPATPADMLLQLAGDPVFEIQLAVVKNPQTPASVLAVLAEHPEKAVQEAVAEHRHATEEILHRLFPRHQDILRERKKLPASILERFFRETATEEPLWEQYSLLRLLLREPNTPAWILSQLAEVDVEELRRESINEFDSSDFLEVGEEFSKAALYFLADVAKHPQVTGEILERVSQYPSPVVKLAVAQNAKTPEALKLLLLEELSVHPDEVIQVQVAKDIHTPVSVLEAMARNEFYPAKLLRIIRRILASECAEDADWFQETDEERIICKLKREVLYPANIAVDVERWLQVIQNSDILERLAGAWEWDLFGEDSDSSSEVERALPLWVEVLPGLPVEKVLKVMGTIFGILESLNSDVKTNYSMRSVAVALAGNPNTPAGVREQLNNQLIGPPGGRDYYNSYFDIFLAIAYNTAIPEAERRTYFQTLITAGVALADIAEDPRTPADILEQLLERGQQQAIAKNPAAPESLLRRIADRPQPHDGVLRVIAENPKAPPDLLVRFVRQPHENRTHSNVSMLDLVLDNPNLPVEERYRFLLEKEENEKNAKAREFVSRRLNSPYALAELLKSGDRNALYSAARNPLTPAHILEQLAKHPDESVRRVLVDNPNLPASIRLELARDPSVSVRCKLARKDSHRQTPAQVLELLANDESEQVREYVAENSDTPAEILVKLANDTSRQVKTKVSSNLNTPVEVLERLGLSEGIFSPRNPNTPGSVLDRAVSQMPAKQLENFLKYPVKGSQIIARTLARLASHSNNSVRYHVAAHPNTPASALEILSFHSDVSIVRAVAANPNTPPDILVRLTGHPDSTTRYNVGKNPNIPPAALELLALSSESEASAPPTSKDALKSVMSGADINEIRSIVASNPRTPLFVLQRLALREIVRLEETGRLSEPVFSPTTVEDVLEALVSNPSLTPQILASLAVAPSPKIRRLLIEHPNLTPELWQQLAGDEDASVRGALASHLNCPISLLETLASDRERDIRQKVAAHPNTPATTLEFLSRDVDAGVRVALAANPKTAGAVLEKLAQDEKVEVRRAAAQNPNTPTSLRESLRYLLPQPISSQPSPTLRGLSRIYNPNTDDLPTVLSEYAQSPNAFVRFVALSHPLTPASALRQGSQSLFWLLRCAVAGNPGTPADIRNSLAQDSNRIVRATAKASLQNSIL
ncbi:hypothetical protein [Kamptonema formosum]|uniref:hypothetical protein n=1 Tax=Kamptonema formosum TaxID=331992 RepID=UPI0003490C8D|nr:hypothetical protein [Oscillatoria sp. PCC 10802]